MANRRKNINNGVILIIVPQEHLVRIEVGYGLEGILTDALCSEIIQQNILPEFRNNNYKLGIDKGINSILSVLNKEVDKDKNSFQNFLLSSNNTMGIIFIFLVIIFLILLIPARFLLFKYEISLKNYAKNSNIILKILIWIALIILYISALGKSSINAKRDRYNSKGGSFG